MNGPRELAQSWMRKADSDLAAAALSIEAGKALDTACFHAQQAAEKYLKAYLVCRETDFPFSHHLEKLVELCANHDDAFTQLLEIAADLTPYAVELRYDNSFWPSEETAVAALKAAEKVKEFVLAHLPADSI